MKFIQAVVRTIRCIRQANYSATLARNGKIKEAQAAYK